MTNRPARGPVTPYQWCLYVVGYPWLSLVYGPAKPGQVLLGYFAWMAAVAQLPSVAALIGIVLPVVVLLVSMAASVLLVLELDGSRLNEQDPRNAVERKA